MEIHQNYLLELKLILLILYNIEVHILFRNRCINFPRALDKISSNSPILFLNSLLCSCMSLIVIFFLICQLLIAQRDDFKVKCPIKINYMLKRPKYLNEILLEVLNLEFRNKF